MLTLPSHLATQGAFKVPCPTGALCLLLTLPSHTPHWLPPLGQVLVLKYNINKEVWRNGGRGEVV